MGELQRVADLGNDFERFARRQFAGLLDLPQVRPIDVFHDEIVQPVGLSKIIDGDNVGMAQFGQRASLAAKTFGKTRIRAGARRQDL